MKKDKIKKVKKTKRVKLKGKGSNGTAKGKTYRFVTLPDGTLAPRDWSFPCVGAPETIAVGDF